MNEDRQKVIASLCPYTSHTAESNSASVGPVADALININESIQQMQRSATELRGEISNLNRRAHEARVCREAQTKRISRGEKKRQELQDELNRETSLSREQGRIIRDLAKRITKLENPLYDEGREISTPARTERDAYARGERVNYTETVFVVTRTN